MSLPGKAWLILVRLVILAPFLFAGSAYAQMSHGGYSEAYLLRDIGARATAMGGAYTSILNDPAAIFYNPANLSYLPETPKINAFFTAMEYGRVHTAICWGQTVAENLGVGIGINSFNNGNFTATDARGNSLGDYSNWQMSVSGAVAYKLDFASFGATVKYLSNRLTGSDIKADGYSLDVGTQFNVVDMFAFGVSMQNVSGMMFWKGGTDERELLPFTIRAGISLEYPLDELIGAPSTPSEDNMGASVEPAQRYVLLGFDAVFNQHAKSATFLLGAEVSPDDMVAFRGGLALMGDDDGSFKFLPWTQWGAGISLKSGIFELPFKASLDYSVSSDYMSFNKISHHISLMVDL